MVVSSIKFFSLISWSLICTPLIIVSVSTKMASPSGAVIYNSMDNGHSWQTAHAGVKESDRRPFILASGSTSIM